MRLQLLSRVAVTCLAALALAACASKPRPPAAVDTPSSSAELEASRPPSSETPIRASALQADLAATAGDRVYFGLDSYDLDGEGLDRLARQADWLLRHPGVRAIVAGNCDERGTREYNLALGARRAAAAKAVLISRGVSASRLETVSYGKERPIAGGSDEAALAQNRNAHTVLIDLAPG